MFAFLKTLFAKYQTSYGKIVLVSLAMLGAIEATATPLSASRQLLEHPNYVAAVGPILTPLGYTRFCFAYGAQCKVSNPIFRPKRMAATEAMVKDLDIVNRSVNRAIRPQADAPGLLNDIWTIAPRAGDCDDYAVTKRAELLKKGWSSRALLLAKVVAPSGEDHLVLVARTRLGDFVLDNQEQKVKLWTDTGYRFIKRQSQENPNRWVSLGNFDTAIATASSR
jgi:predicted transglutaminase-like cysteine proteinase